MSLDGLRDAQLREKKNEIASSELSLKRKLRELYHYSALLSSNKTPQLRDWLISDVPSEHEARFLDENDIAQGRRFNDSTVPFPNIISNTSLPSTLPFQTLGKPTYPAFPRSSPAPIIHVPASLEDQLRAASASPSVPSHKLPSPKPTVSKHVASVEKVQSPSPGVPSPPQATEPVDPVLERDADATPVEEQQQIDAQLTETGAAVGEDIRVGQVQETEDSDDRAVEGQLQEEVEQDRPSVDPKEVITPTIHDVVEVPDVSPPSTTAKEAPRAPQVVHLPPQKVQEARLKETERKLDIVADKERREDERLAPPNAAAHADLVSSPSSTVGPYSQATPHPPHHSPDTSPDTDSFQDNELPAVANNVGPDPEVQMAKDEHDRELEQRLQDARERARADNSETPDVQRQIEDEQAIRLARDGKSRLNEAQPGAGSRAPTEHAEEVVQEISVQSSLKDAQGSLEEQALQAAAADSLPTPTTTVPEPSNLNTENTDSLRSKQQESTLMGPDHPTPPADVEVEMGDAPLLVKEQPQASLQPQASPTTGMVTRTGSGAMRKRSVTETIHDNSASKSVLTPHSSSLSTSVSPARQPLSRDRKTKEVSTVIFAKPDLGRPSKNVQSYNEDYASLQGASQDSGRDYLEGLFQYQAHHPPRSTPLQELVSSARKTVSTAAIFAMNREQQDYKILKRVYQLQNANRWSLRQLQKSAEPSRPTTHQDHLLMEMKWMQTDFIEERKWKQALAITFAEWCAEYVNSSPEDQASLRVRARIPPHARRTSNAEEDMNDAPTPDLMASRAESESFADDEELLSLLASIPPAGLFTLGFNDVVMKIDHNNASDAMLRELPTYEPSLEGSSDVTPISFCDPPILPVSKFVTGKLVSKVRGPTRKRSRYEYESEDEPSTPPSRSGTSAEHSMPSTPGRRLFHRNDLPPEMIDVALFNPENKHVRDRLQVAHQFRPPTEFPMPSVSFFENRNASQWLWEEDQKLRGLVKEYTFNWSLVAQQLALPSEFVSGSGRRTPWECFERWVQLEGLPAEMSKTQYFRTYQTRLEQAQRTIQAQFQAQAQLLQQQGQQGQNVPGPQRRRSTQPIRVERRRENRHLAIIDGMRKLARKRESIAHKQAESQKAAALRKAQEPAPPKSNVHTPQEFSRLKWEREEKLKQKQMQQDISMRQAMLQRQAQAQLQGQAGMSNGVNQPQRNGAPSANINAVPTSLANSTSQQGGPANNIAMTARAHPNQQAVQGNFSNGNMSGMSMGNSGVPQAQMQAAMPNGQRMAPPNSAQMAMQRSQFPNSNQHQFQLQQQQINMASNLTQNIGMNGIPNANMIAMTGQNLNGNMTNSMNGMPNNARSPQLSQVNPTMQGPARPLSSGHMPQLLQIQNNLKNQHPEWPPEQLQKVASDQLSRFLTKQRAQAMTAAAGSSGMNTSPQIGNNVYLQNGGGMANSPSPNAVQNYQQQLVQQQRMMSQQQRHSAGSPGLNTSTSRSGTPQNPQLQQSPGLQQAQLSGRN
ncbi:hypothetical protein K504DRAFT_463956 [Pleomassaria siparia CBS 279.74]|uniref:Vacuolar import and degradation protein 21 n=1 Tax=Pleomassaria siparia CBS 279.74 TaxID=1314801 RepID=A0A6G1JQW7_9PLEO|nr:hypothetical protein K504DRAFT_463956 [Pleomassaria siparia CBS 279.74]